MFDVCDVVANNAGTPELQPPICTELDLLQQRIHWQHHD
jgi:hypothetical protein